MEHSYNQPIGVLDSGLGGLTVARELSLLLPQENIVYFGDNANCPYGNRQQSEILDFTIAMLDFLSDRGVKLVAIACNTISALIDNYRDNYDFPIVSIIEAACGYVAPLSLAEVGVFATVFTIKQRVYETLIRSLSPQTAVFGVPSRELAALVDAGNFDGPEIEAEINSMLYNLRKLDPTIEHAVLGCTHFQIVEEQFKIAAPNIEYINPALAQAKLVKSLLAERKLLASGSPGRMEIFTSGDGGPYEAALQKLEIRIPVSVNVIRNSAAKREGAE